MSQLTALSPAAEPSAQTEQQPPPRGRRASWTKRLAVILGGCLLAGVALFYGLRAYRSIRGSTTNAVPTAKVQRGDLSLTIVATGALRGQHPEVLSAPMTGGNELHITALLKSGTPVRKGDVIVKFDTTEQEYKLKALSHRADVILIRCQAASIVVIGFRKKSFLSACGCTSTSP